MILAVIFDLVFRQVSAYAIVTEYGDTCNTVDVKFYMFSPYNYGKDVW